MESNHLLSDVSRASCRWTTGRFFCDSLGPIHSIPFAAARVRFELTASFGLSESGLPIAYLAPTAPPSPLIRFAISSGGRNRTDVLLVQSQASRPTATSPVKQRVERESNPQGFRSSAFEAVAIARWLAHPTWFRLVSECWILNLLLALRRTSRAPSGSRTRTSAMARQQATVTSWVHKGLP